MNWDERKWFMQIALEEAEEAYRQDEVPVGAVVVSDTGELLSKAHNIKESNSDSTGHAEILAIRGAGKKIGNWRLSKATLIVTLEPCIMCLAAMVQARIGELIFGAYDAKAGAISLNYTFHKDARLNHNFNVVGGFNHFPCSKIVSQFFKARRNIYGA